MKKIVGIICFFTSFLAFSQDIAVKRQFSIDASTFGLGVTYEQPLSTNILVEGSAGVGSSMTLQENFWGATFNVGLFDFSPYTRVLFGVSIIEIIVSEKEKQRKFHRDSKQNRVSL